MPNEACLDASDANFLKSCFWCQLGCCDEPPIAQQQPYDSPYRVFCNRCKGVQCQSHSNRKLSVTDAAPSSALLSMKHALDSCRYQLQRTLTDFQPSGQLQCITGPHNVCIMQIEEGILCSDETDSAPVQLSSKGIKVSGVGVWRPVVL